MRKLLYAWVVIMLCKLSGVPRMVRNDFKDEIQFKWGEVVTLGNGDDPCKIYTFPCTYPFTPSLFFFLLISVEGRNTHTHTKHFILSLSKTFKNITPSHQEFSKIRSISGRFHPKITSIYTLVVRSNKSK